MGTSSTTTQRNDPYGPSQPYINQGLADAGGDPVVKRHRRNRADSQEQGIAVSVCRDHR